jgi:hypothetical protein
VPLCPPRIPHGLTWARIRGFTVRGRRLIAWAMAWRGLPYRVNEHYLEKHYT